MKMTTTLRELIQGKEILVAPGAYDAFSAKLIEAVGFKAVYMTGFGTAASMFRWTLIGTLVGCAVGLVLGVLGAMATEKKADASPKSA